LIEDPESGRKSRKWKVFAPPSLSPALKGGDGGAFIMQWTEKRTDGGKGVKAKYAENQLECNFRNGLRFHTFVA
jgi:hypothetical protein